MTRSVAFGFLFCACVGSACSGGDKGPGTGSSTGSGTAAGSGSAKASGSTTGSGSVAPAGEDLTNDKPLASTIDGKDQKLVAAVLYPSAVSYTGADGKPIYIRELTLKISEDATMDCEHASAGKETLSTDIFAGPENAFFAGKVIALPFQIYSEVAKDYKNVNLYAGYTRLKLAPFTLADDKVKVTLDYEGPLRNGDKSVVLKGSGSIEAKLCKGMSNFKGLTELAKPPAAPDTPVKGKVGEKEFEAKSAIAYLVKDEKTGLDEIVSVALYAAADASCEKGAKSPFDGGGINGARFELRALGLNAKRHVTGSPQPVQVQGYEYQGSGGSFKESGVSFGFPAAYAWVTLDSAEVKEGGTVSGKLYAESGPMPKDETKSEGMLAGKFSAKVCRRSWAY